MNNEFGKIIKYLRKMNSLTQYQLAEKLSYTRVQISKIESGSIEPSKHVLLKLSSIFKIDLNSLTSIFADFSSMDSYEEYKKLRLAIEHHDQPTIERIWLLLRSRDEFKDGEPLQLMLYSEALVLTYTRQDYLQSISKCIEGISVFYRNSYEEKLKTINLSNTTYSLLALLVANYEFVGDIKSCKKLATTIIENLRTIVFRKELPLMKYSYFMQKCYAVSLNNYAHVCFISGDYNSSIDAINEGIEICNTYSILHMLPYLLHLKFENYYLLEDYIAAQLNYDAFKSLLHITNNVKLLKSSKILLETKYTKLDV